MTQRSISAYELKQLTGQRSLMHALNVAGERIERRTWRDAEREYRFAGLDWRKDRVLFFACWNVAPGVAAYRHKALSIADALDTPTGNLAAAHVV